MAKKDNIFVKAAAYRKEHPRTSFQDAIKKVSGKKISGTKKVTGTSKVSGKPKRKRSTSHLVGVSRVPITGTKKHTIIEMGKKLLKRIDVLEAQRKEVRDKDLKDLYSIEINKCHKKLRDLKKSV